MRSSRDPVAHLTDIIENAQRIERYLHGMGRDDFARNDLVRDAVERCLERVCEAAHRLGDTATDLIPDQPWAEIRGMGNRLRHAYDRIVLDVVWNAVTQDLSSLAADATRVRGQLQTKQHGSSSKVN